MTDYVPRELAGGLQQALDRMPVVVLSGLRQTGKSTMLLRDQRFAERAYRSLDDFAILHAARQNPEGLFQSDNPVTLDEAQKAPELLTVIKTAVDRNPVRGRFLLSGSANLALLGHATETLAGRAVYLTLQPLSRREVRRATMTTPFLAGFVENQSVSPSTKIDPIAPDEILRGGLPPVCWETPDHARTWFKGYEQTYIERDVRQFSRITELISFRMLAQLAALRTGQVLKISELARDAKLKAATANRYLHLIEASFLVRRIPPFLGNRSQRLIKSGQNPAMCRRDSRL